MLDKTRPPEKKELLAAWDSLMGSKLRNGAPLNSTQAMQCRRLLEYLTDPKQPGDNKISKESLSTANRVLLEIDPIERSKEHLALARTLYRARCAQVAGYKKDELLAWSQLIQAMCRYGAAMEARDELKTHWKDSHYAKYITGGQRLLETVARGLAYEGRENDLLDFVEYSERQGVDNIVGLQEVVAVLYAKQNHISKTKEWFSKSLESGQPLPQTYLEIAFFAQRNTLGKWAYPYLVALAKSEPKKRYWRILLPSFVLVGTPLEEVKAIFTNMISLEGRFRPNTSFFNSMLRAAATMVDPSLAQDLVYIATENNIKSDAETFSILLRIQVEAGLANEATDAYNDLHAAGSIPSQASKEVWTEYGQTTNGYLRLLCAQRPPYFKHILEVLNLVEEERISLEPETVAALCLRFLENDQHFDVMDILSVHSFLYSEAQREVVQTAFVSFVLDTNTSTSRAWGAYQLLHQFFLDLSFDKRIQLLQAFFDRKRPDMSTYVFGHMRQHSNKAFQPDRDAYVRVFEGFANNPDRAGLETVHNMLKMDMRIQTNTRLNTALMLAHSACERPLKALDFWEQIKSSPEGPSYATLEAVFWTLERKSGGWNMAREIWDKIEAMDLDIPASVYNAYIGAIAGQANEKEIRGLILKMASQTGVEPDALT